MNLETLHDKTIILVGKTRALPEPEFAALLATAKISRVERWRPSVAVVVEGRLANPYEQTMLDTLYAEHGIVPVGIDALEKALCQDLEPDRIIMSLKLSSDRDRLHAFLQNPHIDDPFYLRLLALYDWRKEGFFDSDENRDVTAGLVVRFYDNLARNHNVQYSTLGLLHLLQQRDHDPEPARTISRLEPIRTALQSDDRQMQGVLGALALHPHTDPSLLKQLIRRGSLPLKRAVASRTALDSGLQKELLACADDAVLDALASNDAIAPEIAQALCEQPSRAPLVYAHVDLDDALIARALNENPVALAANPHLDPAMQTHLAASAETRTTLAANPSLRIAQTLHEKGDTATHRALAANPATPQEILHTLLQRGECDPQIAANPAADPSWLRTLATHDTPAILQALASNPATPVDTLYQLQLDPRYAYAVRANPAFGAHVQRENIGWV